MLVLLDPRARRPAGGITQCSSPITSASVMPRPFRLTARQLRFSGLVCHSPSRFVRSSSRSATVYGRNLKLKAKFEASCLMF